MNARKMVLLAVVLAMACSAAPVLAAEKPNIILILSDDFGYGDSGPYGGGVGRGMPTPSLDRLSAQGMTLYSFYAQPSCTPGRCAVQTGRIPNRSGMTTVAFQGQGGGLPAAEWTLASVLKQGGYKTFFTGKWHLGEADYALPTAQGYDEMKYCGLYHLNAYTYGDPAWFPDMSPELRAMFNKVTKSDEPFFMSINFMKVHQPNMPHPDFIHKSMSKSKYADSVVENDTRIGRVLAKAAIAFPPSPGARGSRPARRTTISLVASTSWLPLQPLAA